MVFVCVLNEHVAGYGWQSGRLGQYFVSITVIVSSDDVIAASVGAVCKHFGSNTAAGVVEIVVVVIVVVVFVIVHY
jgi:hypothetical protein